MCVRRRADGLHILYWLVLLVYPEQILLLRHSRNRRISPESKPQAKRDLVSQADCSVPNPKPFSLLSNMCKASSLMIHNSISIHIHTALRPTEASADLWRHTAMQLCSRITERSAALSFYATHGSKSLFCKTKPVTLTVPMHLSWTASWHDGKDYVSSP